MTAWRALYEQHRELRRRSVDLVAAVRRRLVTLAERGHCAGTIQGRFTRRDRGGLREWFIQADGAGADQESLTALRSLRDARLTVLVLLSRKADHVHQFTAMIEGVREIRLIAPPVVFFPYRVPWGPCKTSTRSTSKKFWPCRNDSAM